MFYIPSRIVAYLSQKLSRNMAFKCYSVFILIHSFIASVGAFVAFSHYVAPIPALLGSLTIAYGAYMVKPQTPCAMFTMAWIPWMLVPGFGPYAFGLAILGGYWPVLAVAMPLAVLNPECLLGVILGLPQIIPFLWYWPRSIRAKIKPNAEWGRMPLKRLLVNLRTPENGIHYPEYAFGVGICAVLFIFSYSDMYGIVGLFLALIGFIGARGWFVIARIPARFLYLLSFGLVFASIFAITDAIAVPLVVLQGFLLFKNRDIYPHFPYSQWWRKPSELEYGNTQWPGNTGYLTEEPRTAYYGGFALAENYHE